MPYFKAVLLNKNEHEQSQELLQILYLLMKIYSKTACVFLPGQETLESMSLVARALMQYDNTIDACASNVLVLLSKLWGMDLGKPSTDLESGQEYVYSNQIIITAAIVLIITSI